MPHLADLRRMVIRVGFRAALLRDRRIAQCLPFIFQNHQRICAGFAGLLARYLRDFLIVRIEIVGNLHDRDLLIIGVG